MNELPKEKMMVSHVDIMHGIQEQASFACNIKANAVDRIMPLSIILMQPFDVTCPCLEPMVLIIN
jgi:hypothetical protein